MNGRTPWALYILLGASLALNVALLLRSPAPAPVAEPAAPASKPVALAAARPPASEADEPDEEPSGPAIPASAAAAASAAPASAAPSSAAAPTGEWQVVRAQVDRTIPQAIAAVAGPNADALAAEYARLFVWDLDLRKDLQRGDTVEFAWRQTATGELEIGAARLTSSHLGKTVAAYLFQADGDKYPSYWHPDGSEAPLRLVGGPLDDYEQITSLLKDRPTHKGMDFKTPVGTPVHAPRDAVVTRTNWNWGANGNCVELRLDDGIIAKFLHLSATKVNPGDHVTKGQIVALTGNTGHTTAPHLHYQLERDGNILDPLEYHKTTRRQMPAAAQAAFQAEMKRLDALFGVAGR
jgi:murein DD-endopeptidase MepM/ murein hydrolase activator NlpD